jgi:hypothetical protein
MAKGWQEERVPEQNNHESLRSACGIFSTGAYHHLMALGVSEHYAACMCECALQMREKDSACSSERNAFLG